MNIRSSLLLALALSLSAMACADTTESASSSAAAQTGPQIEPGPVMNLSADGEAAADALLQVTARYFDEPSSAQGRVVKEWLGASLTDVRIGKWEDATDFFFSGDELEGDIVLGTKHLTVQRTTMNMFEGGPFYIARKGDGQIPQGVVTLGGVDLEALSAIAGASTFAARAASGDGSAEEIRKFMTSGVSLVGLEVRHLAPGDTSYKITGAITHGGDVIEGYAYLDLRATTKGEPEYQYTTYEANVTFDKDEGTLIDK